MNRQIVLLLLVMVIAVMYAGRNETKYNKKICIVTITALMACFSGFRSWWMGDLIKYYTDYINCNGEGWYEYIFEDYTNVGLKLFFRGSGFLGISYDICIFIIAVFTVSLLELSHVYIHGILYIYIYRVEADLRHGICDICNDSNFRR